MQEIRLIQMRIQNFKGIRDLAIHFAGKDMNVFGDNGTGKTSIIDSFTWLLFGKDSLDRADFGIKPTDSAGNVIHQLETSVEAVFDVSGTERTFKKTLSEVWTRKRGAAEAEFTRNENNFYIDGVPKKKSEYTAVIARMIDEDVFKIITNPLYFNEAVNWRDRRRVLLAICGEVSDEEVIASNPELYPLTTMLEGKSVADFKDITAASMKRINQELDMIPVKINEAELAKPNASALEVDTVRRDELLKEIEELRIKKSNLANGVETAHAKQRAEALRQELNAVGKDFNPDWIPESAEVNRLKSELLAAESLKKNAIRNRDLQTAVLDGKRKAGLRYSEEWDKVFSERFTDSICPTCHRELPEEEVEERRKEFNINKAKRLDEIEAEMTGIKSEIDTLNGEINAEIETIMELGAKMDRLESDIKAAEDAKAILVASKEAEFSDKRSQIATALAEAEKIIRDYESDVSEMVIETERRIQTLSSELFTINEAVANKALLERQDKRIAELREQQTHLAREYTRQERHLYLSEQFIIAKVNMLNERINQKFKYAKFKLFDRQINGGINEVCEVTYKGIPYRDLNNAARVNVGLDIINTISGYYGTTCPIMIDNCESVNVIYPTAAQQVRFYVSHDNPMRMEVGE